MRLRLYAYDVVDAVGAAGAGREVKAARGVWRFFKVGVEMRSGGVCLKDRHGRGNMIKFFA